MQTRNQAIRYGSSVLVLFGTFVGQSHAVLDLSPITAAVDVGTIAVALIALAAIKIAPNVAKWAGNKMANFF